MIEHRTTAQKGLWTRTTQALGKFLVGVLSLAEDRQQKSARAVWNDYPHFPPY